MKNKIFFLLLFLVFSLSGKSQTYIAPFYGYGSSYLYPSFKFEGLIINGGYNPYLYRYLHENVHDLSTPVYLYQNHLYGLKINQIIGKRFELDLESSFSVTKHIPMEYDGYYLDVTSFGYNKYSFLLNLKYYPVKFLYISAGPGVEKTIINRKYTPFAYGIVFAELKHFGCISRTQINYNLAVGGMYNNFFCELKFIDGFTNIEGNDLLFYPISSFYAVIGYRLKIYPFKNKKKVDCPKF